MKRLDIGCGVTPSGDVNTDLYVSDKGHRVFGLRVPKERIKNFVVCDGQHLPFKDACFDIVYSSHVIEHVDNPEQFLNEMVRVSDYQVIVKTPHVYGDKFHRALGKSEVLHKHFFRCRWFWQYGAKHGLISNVQITRYRPFPSTIIPIAYIPDEITAQYFKN